MVTLNCFQNLKCNNFRSAGNVVILSRSRINGEVQTLNREAGKEGAVSVETGVKRGLKKAHWLWIRGSNSAQTVNWGGAKPWSAHRELGIFHLQNHHVYPNSVQQIVSGELAGEGLQTGFSRHGLPHQRDLLDTVYPLREHLNSVQRMLSGGYCEGLFPDTVCWTRLRIGIRQKGRVQKGLEETWT